MSIEGGGIDGGISGGIGIGGANIGGGIEMGGAGLGVPSGIEAGGLAAGVASAAPGLETRFGPVMGPVDTGLIGSEGVFKGSLADFNPTLPVPDLGGTSLPLEQMNIDVISQAREVAGHAWNASTEPDAMPVGQPKIDVVSQAEAVGAETWDSNVLTQAEVVLLEAQKPVIFSPVIPSPFSVIPSEERNLPQWEIAASSLDKLETPRNDEIFDFNVQSGVLPQVEPMILPFALPNIAPKILEFPKPQVVTSPAGKPAVQAGPQAETGGANEAEPATAAQPVLREQVVEETVTERTTAKQIDTVKEETEERKIIVEDEETAAQRRFDIRAAIKKAKALVEQLGLKKITGAMVARFIHAEYAGVRSQIIKEKGPDGSYQETVETIAGSGEFESETEAEEKSDKVVAEKKPAKYGKNSTPLAFEHVARVLKYFFGKPKPVEQMIDRVKKKKIVVKEGQKPSLVGVPKPRTKESRIVDFPVLSEAFPKAT